MSASVVGEGDRWVDMVVTEKGVLTLRSLNSYHNMLSLFSRVPAHTHARLFSATAVTNAVTKVQKAAKAVKPGKAAKPAKVKKSSFVSRFFLSSLAHSILT